MTTSNRRWIAAATVGAALLVGQVPPASAADDGEAIRHYERGLSLYQSGAYDAALVEFQTSYQLSKNAKLLFNIGVAANEAREHAVALGAFRKYLEEGGASISEEKQTAARGYIEQLELIVRDVSVATNAPAGAEVLVDDKVVGTSPLGPTLMKIGRHRIVVTAGARTASQAVDVASGKGMLTVRVDLPPIEASASLTQREPQKDKAPEDTRPGLPYWSYGLAGALAAGTIVTGALAVGAKNEAYREGATFGSDPARVDSLDSRATAFGVTSDVLLGLTVASAALATYLTISRLSSSKAATTTDAFIPFGGTF
jgi:hypothetical protein